MNKNCSFCNKEIGIPPSREKINGNFCSRKCANLNLKTNKPRKCKNCGKEYYVSKSQVFYRNIQCCSNECRYAQMKKRWVDAYKIHKKESRKKKLLPRHLYTRKMKKGKARTLKSYIKKLDKIFSLYTRKKTADQQGNVKCITCERIFNYLELDAGHYVSRRYLSLRFDERNVHPQCKWCNRFQNGAMDSYSIFLIITYGPQILKELAAEKRKVKQFTVRELEGMIEEFKGKLSTLQTP